MDTKVLANWAFIWEDVQPNLPEGDGVCLDVGCGNGRHRVWVESAGWIWVGIDVDVNRRLSLSGSQEVCLNVLYL